MAELTRNERVINEFRANGGLVVEKDRPPRTLLLLTTSGRKSRTVRTTPLVYLADGSRFVVFATHGGAPEDPDWFKNLMAAGTATVEIPGDSFIARPVVATAEERERLWTRQIEAQPTFAEYQQKTNRVIPVVALVREENQ